ncbi:hypothetical protein E3J79_01770 [Candidatus Dependentiae bacterium]|nr:MAG: hypothetical protein E3J79_01770 [Candidatus Dependentiae bacterium]
MAIKKLTSAYLYIYLLIASGMTLLGTFVVFLIFECHYFHTNAKELCSIKEDYRNYTAALKKILHDYNKTKERLDLLENYLEKKKKTKNIEKIRS